MTQSEATKPKPRPTLRLRVSRAAESRVRQGHPWVYAESVRTSNRPGSLGEPAVIFDRKDRFLAVGLFDPHSPIQVRILQRGKGQLIDEAFFEHRLQTTLATREGLFPEATTGYRLIHGESDGWPALVLDRYDRTLVLKLYSGAWLPRLDLLKRLLDEALGPERIVLRLSRNLAELAFKDFGCSDGSVLFGPPVEQIPVFKENGIYFEADVIRGQKTGFFLDQRENRVRIEKLAKGKHVLNAFSFTGGFSLYAAKGGARSVTDLDISAHALASAERNLALNKADPSISRCSHHRIQADVFKWLQGPVERLYDLIVLDPPSLARRKSERQEALGAYGRLARRAIGRLSTKGVLFAASCSAQIPAEEFFGVVRQAARSSGRRFKELETTGHPADHPATFPEASYLKGIYLRIG